MTLRRSPLMRIPYFFIFILPYFPQVQFLSTSSERVISRRKSIFQGCHEFFNIKSGSRMSNSVGIVIAKSCHQPRKLPAPRIGFSLQLQPFCIFSFFVFFSSFSVPLACFILSLDLVPVPPCLRVHPVLLGISEYFWDRHRYH